METAFSILVALIYLVLFLFLVAYVTWLFAVRLRAKESPPKSFLRWLKDLYELLLGL
jgi:hypothetical protein